MTNRHSFGIFKLTEADRPAYEKHLLSLDASARRLRFGLSLPDDSLLSIAKKLPLEGCSLGLYVWGELKGCVQVLPLPGGQQAELAVSISPDLRGRGWGKSLVAAAIERAGDQQKDSVEIFYLRENAAMHRIASRLPGPLDFEASDVCKHVNLHEIEDPVLFPV